MRAGCCRVVQLSYDLLQRHRRIHSHLGSQYADAGLSVHVVRTFLPRCIECRRGLAMRILSVCPSVCQTRALRQNGRKSCPDF